MLKKERLLTATPSDSTGEPTVIAILWADNSVDEITESEARDLRENLIQAERQEEAREVERAIRLMHTPISW